MADLRLGRKRPGGWRKSSFCASSECAEVRAGRRGRVLVRSSRRPWRRVRLTRAEWAALAAGVKAGEFDQS